MLKTHIIYKGNKPDVHELLQLMPILDITFERTRADLRTVLDPIYKIQTLSWVWFRGLFQGEVDVRALVLEEGDLKGVGVSSHWGFYSLDSDKTHDFYMTNLRKLDSRAKANGFKTNFAWMFVHEYLHGAVWEETKNRGTAASLVHQWETQGVLKAKLEEHLNRYATLSAQEQEATSLLAKLIAMFTPKRTVYQTALKYLGVDASPNDIVDDVVGCAESVTTILREHIKMPIIPGTASLYAYMNTSPLFKRVTIPMPGDIILSPTGMGNGKVQGHVGIVGQNNIVMSNDSYTGKWMANFTIATWRERYEVKGRLPVVFYKVI